ncbi:MAG TPA: DUF2933 domain-containing protein [Burkholderiales bacterium]|nr:DUF2933 domain-containing protein [Burkholderiales bacterium]
MNHEHRNEDGRRAGTARWKWAFAGFLAIAAFFLLTEHRAHVLGWLPFLILLACPLLHGFLHGGHQGHGGSAPPGDGEDRQRGGDCK